jgi:hypothetical protein
LSSCEQEKKILIASQRACSNQNFAVQLMEIFFNEDELTIPNLNVRGQKHKGSNEDKVGLDAEKLELE